MRKIIQLASETDFIKKELMMWNETDYKGNFTLRWFLIVKYGVIASFVANLVKVLINI